MTKIDNQDSVTTVILILSPNSGENRLSLTSLEPSPIFFLAGTK